MYQKIRNTAIYWFGGVFVCASLIYSTVFFYNRNIDTYISNSTVLLIDNAALLILFGLFLYSKKNTRSATGSAEVIPRQPPGVPSNDTEPSANTDHITYTDSFLVDNIPPLFCIKDAKGRWLYANQTYLDFFDLSDSDYAGKTNIELSEYPGSKLEALRFDAGEDKKTWDRGKPRQDSGPLKLSVGNSKFDITRIPLYDQHQQRLRLFITGIAAQRRTEAKSKLYSAVFFSSHIPFLLLDNRFKIILVNNSFIALTEFSLEDIHKKDLFFLENNGKEVSENLHGFFGDDRDRLWSREMDCSRKSGARFPAKIVISPLVVQHMGNTTPYYVANIFDITQQKLDAKRIMQIAHFDDLTGLPNRIMFCDRLAQSLSAARRHKTSMVVLFLDLDRFKSVNDSLGHQAGDELLKEAAARLTKQVRKEDIVARLSGDEFAILLANEKSHETAIYASTIVAEKIISELSAQFYIQRQEVFVGASIGIAIYPEDANSVETLLKHANAAMYEAKKQGRNNFQFFHQTYIDKTNSKHQLELGLRNALPKNELHLYFQPQYKSEDGGLWGAEVLIRWSRERTKMISPDYFIPLAEEIGLIIPIGKWILETACTQMKKWLENGYNIRQVSVNISARQFMDPRFVDIVEEALEKSALDAQHLELEITESMLIGDTRKIELQLGRIKKMGIKIALDDFGTGYSSLSYLKKFPIDILKIDKSFIKEMTVDSKDSRIACAIIDMGHSLGQKIVAEGVENEMQFNYLRQRGCDIIQGYYFSPPLSVNEMTKLLDEAKKVKRGTGEVFKF